MGPVILRVSSFGSRGCDEHLVPLLTCMRPLKVRSQRAIRRLHHSLWSPKAPGRWDGASVFLQPSHKHQNYLMSLSLSQMVLPKTIDFRLCLAFPESLSISFPKKQSWTVFCVDNNLMGRLAVRLFDCGGSALWPCVGCEPSLSSACTISSHSLLLVYSGFTTS